MKITRSNKIAMSNSRAEKSASKTAIKNPAPKAANNIFSAFMKGLKGSERSSEQAINNLQRPDLLGKRELWQTLNKLPENLKKDDQRINEAWEKHNEIEGNRDAVSASAARGRELDKEAAKLQLEIGLKPEVTDEDRRRLDELKSGMVKTKRPSPTADTV